MTSQNDVSNKLNLHQNLVAQNRVKSLFLKVQTNALERQFFEADLGVELNLERVRVGKHSHSFDKEGGRRLAHIG